MNLLNNASVLRIIQFAINEDVGGGDITTECTVSPESNSSARFLVKQDGVVCGLPMIDLVFREFSPNVEVTLLVEEGAVVEAGTVIATAEGPAHALLAGERTALNFLQRMSGVATMTRRFVDRIYGTGTRLLDTRKTIPGWRILDKYSAQIGGAVNHRMGLHDMVMIKDNHITAAGGVKAAIEACMTEMAHRARVPIEVEAASLEAVREILTCDGVDRVMFDNFTPSDVRKGVDLVAGRLQTEASGGVTYHNVRDYAETGVDFISSGAITHSATALDISMKLVVPRNR